MIILILIILGLFIVPAFVKSSKISEAEEIKKRNPDGVRKVIGWIPGNITYDAAKTIVDKQSAIRTAQWEYEEAERRKAEARRIADKARSIRRDCPDVCTGKTDEYLASHEASIRNDQRRYTERKDEAIYILDTYRDGAAAICGISNRNSLTAAEIDKLIDKRYLIISEQKKISDNRAEVAMLEPQLSELRRQYPLGVKAVLKEKGWSLNDAEDIRSLLLMKGTLSQEQQKEETRIINSKFLFNSAVAQARYVSSYSKATAKTRTFETYGEVVTNKIWEIIDADEKFQEISESLDVIEKKQNEFAQETRNMFPETISGFGWYNYSFGYTHKDNFGHSKSIKMNVWQPFKESCCLDDTVSYEYYPRFKKHRISKTQLESTYSYNESVWDKIMSLISKIKEKYGLELLVILANTDNLSESAYENNFSIIKSKLEEAGISYREYPLTKKLIPSINKKIIVIDIVTENKNLVKLCEDIYNLKYGNNDFTIFGSTGLLYITLLKCYDGAEITEMNEKAIKAKEEEIRKARKEEERKKREEEQRIKDQNDISSAKSIASRYPIGFKFYFPEQSLTTISVYQARSIIQKESSIRDYEAFLIRIKGEVSKWETVKGVPHYFFYHYYPIRFTDVSYDSKQARSLVYNFKDGVAHNTVKNLVVTKLQQTFSSSDLSRMTFVCIPASTIAVNKSRYEAFSKEVSQALNMWNGYEHITITREKTPSHLGGTDSAEYSYDRRFFKDKTVVLFDDIVTRGGSISSMKSNLESLGAKVICAISIGRTFSDWNGQTPQPHPYTGHL